MIPPPLPMRTISGPCDRVRGSARKENLALMTSGMTLG
jgi:hypothetical protein